MSTLQNRRDFLQTTLAGVGTAALAPSLLKAAELTPVSARKASDTVPLANTGIKCSLLAQGTGYNGGGRQSDHTRMGTQAFETLLRRSLDSGVRFLDTADLYGTHSYLRPIIKGVPREQLTILSKLWPTKQYWVSPSGGAKEEVDRFRKELGVDMLDICLIHCMQNAQWPEEFARIRDELSELKQKQAVRAVGVSCHDLQALKVAATHPWVDVIFARINNKGGNKYAMDGTVEEVSEVLRTARKNGKAVVGMKIFGAGLLVSPEEKDASLKYVFSERLVDAITVGMKTPQETEDTVTRINGALKSIFPA